LPEKFDGWKIAFVVKENSGGLEKMDTSKITKCK